MIEPFGYFKADPCGWTDCAETDEGAIPLYDRAAIDAAFEIAAKRAEAYAYMSQNFIALAEELRGLKS
jgi:hypothetical protein